MSQSSVALAFSIILPLALSACAGTPAASTATAQQAAGSAAPTQVCKMVSDDTLGTQIKVRKECTDVPASATPIAPPQP